MNSLRGQDAPTFITVASSLRYLLQGFLPWPQNRFCFSIASAIVAELIPRVLGHSMVVSLAFPFAIAFF